MHNLLFTAQVLGHDFCLVGTPNHMVKPPSSFAGSDRCFPPSSFPIFLIPEQSLGCLVTYQSHEFTLNLRPSVLGPHAAQIK